MNKKTVTVKLKAKKAILVRSRCEFAVGRKNIKSTDDA